LPFTERVNFGFTGSSKPVEVFLLLDADMVVEIKNFDKMELSKASSFSILQGSDTFYYYFYTF